MSDKTIVVFGATGQQGQGVVSSLLAQGEYSIRAVSRNPSSDKAQALVKRGVEVVAADLNKPESLNKAMEGAYGVFLVTNFWDPSTGASEYQQVDAVVNAAKLGGVEHFVWSTLPDVEEISGGKFKVVHFSNKAKANALVSHAGFKYHSFVEAPFFFQNFTGNMAPQPMGESGLKGWAVPMDVEKKCIHAGDILELGVLVNAVFNSPEKTGQGEVFSLTPEVYSWQDFANTLNSQGHNVIVSEVANEVYDGFFPGAEEVREMMNYFEEFSYFGPEADLKISRANTLLGKPVTSFASWASINLTN